VKGTGAAQVSTGEDAGGVEITALALADIFPSRIRAYETQPLARVGILCGPRTLNNVRVSVIIPDFMRLPADTNVRSLPSSSARNLDITLLLDNAALSSNNETRTVYGQAAVSFGLGAGAVERKLTAPVLVHDKNAMDWNTPDAVGGFVTFRDPVVTNFAGQAVRFADNTSSVNRDLLNAMALFTAMKISGAGYVKDPSSVSGKTPLDRIQYPRETLKRKSGDCDDLAVLYAAMLESAGIRPAVISYSDHVLVMFNTGIYEKNRLSISPDTLQTICHNGTLWIPVETTMLGKGFVEAWHAAAAEFHSSLKEGRRIDIIDIEKAWQTFPPVPQPLIEMEFNIDGCDKAFAMELKKFESDIQTQLSNNLNALKNSGGKSPDALNRMGVLSVTRNDINGALQYFQDALKLNDNIEYKSNYGCALLMSGDEKSALKNFDAVWKKDPSGRIAVNRALCMFVSARTTDQVEAFINALKDASAMMPSQEKLAEYLGIDLSDGQLSKGDEKQELAEKEINLRRLKELIRKRVLSGTSTESSTGNKLSSTSTESSTGNLADEKKPVILPFGGIRGADPTQVSKIRHLLYWFE
jgi:hypothetical protein